MTRLRFSQALNERHVASLKAACRSKRFGSITFKQAMQFVLTDGVIPQSDALVCDYQSLHAYVLGLFVPTFSATELKNELGKVTAAAHQMGEVVIEKHGKPWLKITALPAK